MKSHIQYFFHPEVTVSTAFFTFSIYEYASSFIDHSEKRNRCHFCFCNRFVRARDTRAGKRDIHKRTVVADHNIIAALLKKLSAADDPANARKNKEEAHPHPEY